MEIVEIGGVKFEVIKISDNYYQYKPIDPNWFWRYLHKYTTEGT